MGAFAHAELLWYLTASHIVWIVLVGAAVLAAVYARGTDHFPRRNTVLAVLLCGWIGVYWAIHAAFSLPLWDRYFLPIAPVFAILCGWIGARVLSLSSDVWRPAVIGLWMVLLLPGAMQAARGGLPIGGDHGAYDGLREVSGWLDSNSPAGAVLYHQSLSWHLQFYLYENPRDYTVRWFASPVALADDAAKRAQQARFVIAPTWGPLRNSHPHLSARELALVRRFKTEQFAVYELVLNRRNPAAAG